MHIYTTRDTLPQPIHAPKISRLLTHIAPRFIGSWHAAGGLGLSTGTFVGSFVRSTAAAAVVRSLVLIYALFPPRTNNPRGVCVCGAVLTFVSPSQRFCFNRIKSKERKGKETKRKTTTRTKGGTEDLRTPHQTLLVFGGRGAVTAVLLLLLLPVACCCLFCCGWLLSVVGVSLPLSFNKK